MSPTWQKLFVETLSLEYGECPYLHHGLINENQLETLLTMQQRFSQTLNQEIDKLLNPGDCLLLAGASLGELATAFAQKGWETTWLTCGDEIDERVQSLNALDIQQKDLLSATLDSKFDCILIEGSFNYLDQLGIISSCRELLKVDGKLLIFAEFLGDDSLIEWSPLPNVSSFNQLSERLGYELIGEKDYSPDAQSSLNLFEELLHRHESALLVKESTTEDDVRSLHKELQHATKEFEVGRRCFRLIQLRKIPNPSAEYASAEYGDIHSFHVNEMAGLFEKSFDTAFNPDVWRWKYELGDGKCVIARQEKGGEIVSHYGGAPRQILYFGKPAMAIQVCDVMVLPEIRKHYGKSSLFFETAATFLEREIGNTVNHLLGFGFPNQKAMNIAIRLGLYEKTDDFVEVVFPSNYTQSVSQAWSASVLDIEDTAHQQDLDTLWQQMLPGYDVGIIGVHDWRYIKYRYFDHPYAKSHQYQCLIIHDSVALSPLAVVVLRDHEGRKLVMDLICPLDHMKSVLTELNQLVSPDKKSVDLKLWITKSWVDKVNLDGATVNELGIEIPCNSWNPGPDAETLEGAWWLTAGDMDFM